MAKQLSERSLNATRLDCLSIKLGFERPLSALRRQGSWRAQDGG
ncbi:hypothetical protein C4K03_4759 [Pseudomonas synxantha]|uniref:Uncharacterized protein n=1 Tax=Pseudomonas synxantha TaxID=47883 RepID=A0A3G7UC03_9PSED|nr:hypothetical protein C4K03_4759 [Pseudomonas synxantha]